jgi:hypothetical protein
VSELRLALVGDEADRAFQLLDQEAVVLLEVLLGHGRRSEPVVRVAPVLVPASQG